MTNITDEQVKAALDAFYAMSKELLIDENGFIRAATLQTRMRRALEAADAAAPMPKHAAVCTRRFGPKGEICRKTILELPTPPKEPQ